MQYPFDTKINLKEFYDDYYDNKISIPVFFKKCPICGAKNCANFHSMYFRKVISPEIDLNVDDFPIFRFICSGLGSPSQVKDKTFSLLPIGLIPYCKFTVTFIIKALLIMLNDNISLNEAISRIDEKFLWSLSIPVNLYVTILSRWKVLIGKSLNIFKSIKSSIFTYELNTLKKKSLQEQFHEFLNIITNYKSKILPSMQGPEALSYDIFESQLKTQQHPYFLFGKASQDRCKI